MENAIYLNVHKKIEGKDHQRKYLWRKLIYGPSNIFIIASFLWKMKEYDCPHEQLVYYYLFHYSINSELTVKIIRQKPTAIRYNVVMNVEIV